MIPAAPTCPIDGKDDQIQKVTATVSDSSKAVLAQRLAKPTLPPEPHFQKAKFNPPISASGVMLICAIPGFLGLIVGGIASQPAIIGAGIIGMFVVAIYFMYRQSQALSEFNKGEKRRKEGIERRHGIWVQVKRELPRMMDDWDRLYYCNRHDIVFVPGDPRGGVAPDGMGMRYGIFRSFDDPGLTEAG